jgi:hypothetical protein
MEKKNNFSSFIWPVVIAIILFTIIIGVMLLINNTNQKTPALNEIKTTLSPEEEITQAALFNLTPQPGEALKPADKIIIKTVNFGAAGIIAEIIMYVPAAMVDANISIEGKQVDFQLSQEEDAFVISLQVPEAFQKKVITFLVNKGGKQIAACSLTNADTLAVSGGCLF